MPRVGVAWRIDNNTALRAGWARFIIPPTLTDGLNILGSVPLPGFDANTTAIGPIAGVPQVRLSDPYPGGLVSIVGKTLGRYTNLGGTGTWYQQNFNAGVNDRFNISVQRQLPWKVVADITYFINYGAISRTTRREPDRPTHWLSIQNAVNASSPIRSTIFCRRTGARPVANAENIAVRGTVAALSAVQLNFRCAARGCADHYQALQMSFQRPFANASISWSATTTPRTQQFYDSVIPPTRPPTRILRIATVSPGRHHELPFGKCRKLMSNANPRWTACWEDGPSAAVHL
jgi:hypothetical protein